MIKEEFLYFIWERQLFSPIDLLSTDNESIDILDKGDINKNDGPDILEAKIKVEQTILVGSIEFHVKTSDWLKHNHHKDSNYKNVILHVVWYNDVKIDSLKCPTLVMQGRVSKYYFDNYKRLMESSKALPCSFAIKNIESDWLRDYKRTILEKRFEDKMNWVQNEFTSIKLNKIYEVFMTVMGTPQNAYGFSQLSQRIPYYIIRKCGNDKHKLEALLFGVSGLLDHYSCSSDYVKQLKQTYLYLMQLYNIDPMTKSDWVFLKVRPSAFPTLRLALLADMFNKINSIEDFVLNESYKSISKIFTQLETSTYWNTHYVFSKISKHSIKTIGRLTILKLWINAIIPLRLLYSENKKETLKSTFLFLENKPSEQNSMNRLMLNNGFKCDNALDSQFNLHKYKYYCIPRKCLNCGIGYKIIRNHD